MKAALLVILLAGCADWNAFLACKYALFQPCPPVQGSTNG